MCASPHFLHPTFPVAAIGASSGGLDAISQLLSHLQPDLGIAYVIIQHLSPDHTSILPDLLHKRTTMKVHLVEDGMRMEPNNVYVIPPATYMTITDGHLVLTSKQKGDKHRHVFDYFLQSLAPVYQHKAIAIVLSGAGIDGTQGVQAIKQEGGISFAQDDSALFQSMTHNAYESGYIDFILSPEGIANELAALSKQDYALASPEENTVINELVIKKIHLLLYNRFGVDFAHYKNTTINRRILRRMALNRLKELDKYSNLLRENPAEQELLYRDLLINVTSFFREPDLFATLAKVVFPALLENRKVNEPLRIWIPACSSGEEACSMAISLFEYLGEKANTTPIQIFATDLSEMAIEKARSGMYSQNTLQHVSPQRLKQFFIKVDGNYQIIKPIRDICIFATHNLLKDPPFSRIDLISCQNVMIYLAANAQKKILLAFHYALKPLGYLALGKSETIGSDTDLFETVDKEHKLYSRKDVSQPLPFDFFNRPSRLPILQQSFIEKTGTTPNVDVDIEKETDKILLSRYTPASLVVNKDLQIVRFNGPINHYLQPAAGKASLHLLKMVRDELVFELRGLLNNVKKKQQVMHKEGIQLKDSDQGLSVRIEVTPVKLQSFNDLCYLIVFQNETTGTTGTTKQFASPKKGKPDSKDRRIDLLEQELKDAREQIKIMNEEFEATREELQSANEEVLSSNEELQSINEELETSKEELQSTNEELITINEELQLRNAELKELVEYTEAIVQTVLDPLVVLHTDLRIRTANKAFYKLFNLQQEIDGVHFFELAGGLLDVPSLRQQLQETVTKGVGFYDFELAHYFRDLGEMTLLFNATRMHSEGDKRARILLAIGNVTERKKLEHQKEEFIAIASHELRTPVTSIKLYSQVLHEIVEAKKDTESLEILEKLNRQIDRLGHLIADLLDITRIGEGQMVLHPELFDINTLIQEIAEAMERTTVKHEIVQAQQVLQPVKADRERIGQVLINLIGNAIKYSPNEGRIIISSELTDQMIRVSIQDFGIGMTEETQSKIFERFYRDSNNNTKIYPGLGLGLFIVSNIIKKHGGQIGVKSELNKGTLVYFTLPIQHT